MELAVFSILLAANILLWVLGENVEASDFTFEITERDKFCVFEEMKDEGEYVFQFRVLRGGNRDVDGYIIAPSNYTMYKGGRVTNGVHVFRPTNGTYEFCVSNQFSTFAHKRVYMSVRRKDNLNRLFRNTTKSASTLLEATINVIYRNLNSIVIYQRSFNRRESIVSHLAEVLSTRVGWWSCFLSLAIAISGFGQVIYLRNLFTFRKSNSRYRQPT